MEGPRALERRIFAAKNCTGGSGTSRRGTVASHARGSDWNSVFSHRFASRWAATSPCLLRRTSKGKTSTRPLSSPIPARATRSPSTHPTRSHRGTPSGPRTPGPRARRARRSPSRPSRLNRARVAHAALDDRGSRVRNQPTPGTEVGLQEALAKDRRWAQGSSGGAVPRRGEVNEDRFRTAPISLRRSPSPHASPGPCSLSGGRSGARCSRAARCCSCSRPRWWR